MQSPSKGSAIPFFPQTATMQSSLASTSTSINSTPSTATGRQIIPLSSARRRRVRSLSQTSLSFPPLLPTVAESTQEEAYEEEEENWRTGGEGGGKGKRRAVGGGRGELEEEGEDAGDGMRRTVRLRGRKRIRGGDEDLDGIQQVSV
jgi:hypothetical protein